ncbi:uncharacterized protein EAE98_009225 [Botrytis deweyae]|uniref:Uncharacterized protein n=1 Tax=Botrytis deweyae TaxID=2478750 RepID=A0ABQ7ICH0_9HELO|nr:uncharacterized protein EAE98_009225 [Botrytis deweyae]KAF7919991.1 hypothetical protein EAE98_009225 [Botrytis deweyae]
MFVAQGLRSGYSCYLLRYSSFMIESPQGGFRRTCGFNHGVDGQKTIGEGPKPVLGHVMGLSGVLDATEKVGREQLGGLLEGKVLALGEWVGISGKLE